MRPYTRSLHPDDYYFLSYVPALRAFQEGMVRKNIPHREWHPHRLWEYGSIMQQLHELRVPAEARILDVGSGGSFFAPYLATVGGYPNLALTDSMDYGDVALMIQMQRDAYGCALPLFALPAEAMPDIPAGFYDVVLCVSTIEHVSDHDAAMSELVRITKPGGYIFLTSDYFRTYEQWLSSPSRHLQVTPYTETFVTSLPELFDLQFVGETDLDYKGDFIHGAYSFVNLCMRRH